MSASPAPAPSQDAPFRCDRLHATIPVWCCIKRQSVAHKQRGTRTNPHRGQASIFPTCGDCAQGERALLAARAELEDWRGHGAGGWCLARRPPIDVGAQMRARERLERSGLLAIPPCLDDPPGEADPSAI